MRSLVVLAAALVAAAPASAAYNPAASLTVPAEGGPGSPAAVSATITQSASEDPTRSIEARLPGTFGFNSLFASTGCVAADEAAGTCPDSSRIGTLSATSPFGEASGAVYLTSDFRLLGRVSAYGGLFQFDSEGLMRVEPGQEIIVRFDGLPALPVSRISLVMDGGAATPLALPRDCGTSEIEVTLASHAGEVRTSTHPVTVSGCRALPRVGRVIVKGRVVSWARAGDTAVQLFRREGRRWVSFGTRVVNGFEVRVGDRWRGRRVRVGSYRVELVAIGEDGRRSLVRAAAVRVRARS